MNRGIRTEGKAIATLEATYPPAAAPKIVEIAARLMSFGGDVRIENGKVYLGLERHWDQRISRAFHQSARDIGLLADAAFATRVRRSGHHDEVRVWGPEPSATTLRASLGLPKPPPELFLECEFLPQVWGGRKFDTAYAAEPRGELTWRVPLSWLEGKAIPESGTNESDELRDFDGAPEWIRKWDGPFEVYVSNREALLEVLDRRDDAEDARNLARWLDDSIQFPRLLAEINATQDKLDLQAIAESMDVTVDEVRELLDRADQKWEEIKRQSMDEDLGEADESPSVDVPRA